jgi:integrase
MPTFAEGWACYTAELAHRHVGDASVRQYQIRLTTWRDWLRRQGIAWQDAGPDELEAFCDRRCLPRAVHTGLPLAPGTRAVYARSIPPFYRACYAAGLLPHERFATYRPPPDPAPSPRPLELADIARLLDSLVDHPDRRLLPLAGLCYYNALRAGETARLRADDVHLGGVLPKLAVLGKGRLERGWLPLHSALVPILGRYTYWLAGTLGASSPRDLPAGTPLFQSRTCPGRGVSRELPSRLLARAMRDAGVDGRPHDLRRTAADQVGERAGDNPRPLREVLRHRGDGALRHYRVPPLGRVQQWFELIPDPTPQPRRRRRPTQKEAPPNGND